MQKACGSADQYSTSPGIIILMIRQMHIIRLSFPEHLHLSRANCDSPANDPVELLPPSAAPAVCVARVGMARLQEAGRLRGYLDIIIILTSSTLPGQGHMPGSDLRISKNLPGMTAMYRQSPNRRHLDRSNGFSFLPHLLTASVRVM